MAAFIHGDFFEETWDDVGAIAVVEIDGKRLVLHGLMVFSLTEKRANPGTRKLLMWLERVKDAARNGGFESLVLDFVRASGANPGRSRVVVVNLLKG